MPRDRLKTRLSLYAVKRLFMKWNYFLTIARHTSEASCFCWTLNLLFGSQPLFLIGLDHSSYCASWYGCEERFMCDLFQKGKTGQEMIDRVSTGVVMDVAIYALDVIILVLNRCY